MITLSCAGDFFGYLATLFLRKEEAREHDSDLLSLSYVEQIYPACKQRSLHDVRDVSPATGDLKRHVIQMKDLFPFDATAGPPRFCTKL
jgi:hypothetical protein